MPTGLARVTLAGRAGGNGPASRTGTPSPRRNTMAIQISKIDVWAGEIGDRPGGLNEALEALSEAGASLEFVIARSAPEKPGAGVVFLGPLRGAAQSRAAKNAGLAKTSSLLSLRLEAPDRAGLGARITQAVADAGINMRGLWAAALGRRSVCYLAFDSDAEARKASRLLTKALAGK